MDAVRLIEANLWSMWSQLGRARGCALHEQGHVLWVETPLPVLPYNMVLRYQAERDDPAEIDAIFEGFRRRQVPFLWMVHPSSSPPCLPERLAERGFAEDEPLTGMISDLDALPDLPDPPEGIELVAVTPDRAYSPFFEFVANRWQVPESARADLHTVAEAFRFGAAGSVNHAWLAVRDGVPLAKAVTHEGGGCVGLYGMVTRQEARGLGLGRLVCLEALAAARARGQRTAVLHSTPMAVSLYAAVGFREEAAFRVFTEPNTFHA